MARQSTRGYRDPGRLAAGGVPARTALASLRRLAPTRPVDQEPVRVRRPAVRQAAVRAEGRRGVLRRLRDLLRPLGRRLPAQRRRRPRGRPAAPAQVEAADRVGPAVAGRRAGGRGGRSAPVALAARLLARPGVRRRSRSPTSCCSTAYSARLKHVVIIDVLTIAIGFVLRAVAGRRGDRRGDQPLAARLHGAAGAVPRAQQAAPRADAARRRRHRAPARSSASTARTCSTR